MKLSKLLIFSLCCICYCAKEVNEKALILGCKHVFHSQCIKMWLKNKPFCPICKFNVRESLDVFNQMNQSF